MSDSRASATAERPVGVAVVVPYLPELESLRGIAILLVLLFHLDSFIRFWVPRHEEVSPLLAYVRAGYSGVNLFFVLSGFLLSLPFLAEAAGGKPVSVRRYFGRRALRILPLYYTAVIAAAVLSASSLSDLLRGGPYLLFLNGFADLTTPLPPYSNVWWSLATEAQFYVVLPLLPLALRSRRGRACGAVVLACLAIAYAAYLARRLQARTIRGEMALGLSLLGRSPMFLAGIGAAWLYLHYGEALRRRLARSPMLCRGGADVILLAVLVGLGYLLRWAAWIGQLSVDGPPYHAWHLLEVVLWAGLLLSLLVTPVRLKPLFSNPLLNRLGVLSYSLYILHVPVLTFGLRWLNDAGLNRVGWNARTAILAPLLCLLCVALSELTYRAIERPFLARKERLRV